MKIVYLISCSTHTHEPSCNAKEKYQASAFFSSALDYASARVDNAEADIHLLSDRCEPTKLSDFVSLEDELLHAKLPEDVQLWAERIVSCLKGSYEISDTKFVFIAADEFVNPLTKYLHHYENPLSEIAVGSKAIWLRQHKKPKRIEEEMPYSLQVTEMWDKNKKHIENQERVNQDFKFAWGDIGLLFEQTKEIQTVTRRGESGVWISIYRMKNKLIVEPAKYHKPCSLMPGRAIGQDEFEQVAAHYNQWKDGTVSMTALTEMSRNCTYIFSIIEYLRQQTDIEDTTEGSVGGDSPGEDVAKQLLDNTKQITCKLSGSFFFAYGYDAYVICQLLGYRPLPDNEKIIKIVLPYSGLDRLTKRLSHHRINFRIELDNTKVVSEQFEDNNYDEFADKYDSYLGRKNAKSEIGEKQTFSIHNASSTEVVMLWSKVTLHDCISNIQIRRTIIPAAEKSCYEGNEFIAEDSPLAKSLVGHKAGETIIHSSGHDDIELFVIDEVENRGISYKRKHAAEAAMLTSMNRPLIHISTDTKEEIKLRKEKKLKREITRAAVKQGMRRPTSRRARNPIDEAISHVDSLIDILLDLDKAEDYARHVKSLINIRVYLSTMKR